MPPTQQALDAVALTNRVDLLAAWHAEQGHPGAREHCTEEVCRSRKVVAWHYDVGHPYAPDMCDHPLCRAHHERNGRRDHQGRAIAGRLIPALIPAPRPARRKRAKAS